ncbi:MAG: YggS family pyridoxal phosphate-dependent enzyme [Anaerolineales bacterium]
MIDQKALRRNLEKVQERISNAARLAGRDLHGIRLVVVTKGRPAASVEALVELGVRDIGESYAEEGAAKKRTLANLPGCKWHMIGHIQSRKASLVAEHFDVIHSLDSLKLAMRLDKFIRESGGSMPVLLECNISGEGSKYGWDATEENSQLWSDIEQIVKQNGLRIQGLMTIAPIVQSPDEARPYFAKLRELRDALAVRFPGADWSQLSMGMSSDYEAAIMEGTTMLRIGTAILGERPD